MFIIEVNKMGLPLTRVSLYVRHLKLCPGSFCFLEHIALLFFHGHNYLKKNYYFEYIPHEIRVASFFGESKHFFKIQSLLMVT